MTYDCFHYCDTERDGCVSVRVLLQRQTMEQPGFTLLLTFLFSFCFALYTTLVIYVFACIVAQASQLQITL